MNGKSHRRTLTVGLDQKPMSDANSHFSYVTIWKLDPNCLVFRCHLNTEPFAKQFLIVRPNAGLVQYSDAYCIRQMHLLWKISKIIFLLLDIKRFFHFRTVLQICLEDSWWLWLICPSQYWRKSKGVSSMLMLFFYLDLLQNDAIVMSGCNWNDALSFNAISHSDLVSFGKNITFEAQ